MKVGGFICRNDDERGRLLDIRKRLRAVEPLAATLLGVGALLGVGTFGPGPLCAAAVTAVVLAVLSMRLERYARPELLPAASFVLTQLAIAAAVATANGGAEYLLPLFALPPALAALTFPRRVVIACVSFTTVLIAGTALLFDRDQVLAVPPIGYLPILDAMVFGWVASVIRDLDAESRSSAVIDRLTGLFNRAALAPRLSELAHQAELTHDRVALIVGDVDHFKSINDEHGHAVGDAVLREIAARLRGCTDAFEPIYRVGGEEFMVILAGWDLTAAVGLAQRMRRAVSERPLESHATTMSLHATTMSFGVSCTEAGEPFDFEAAFDRADAALYKAKRTGRDRVCVMRGGAAPDARPEAGLQPVGEVPGPASPADPAEPAALTAAPVVSGGWRQRLDAERAETGSWIVRDKIEREHLFELGDRLRRVLVGGVLIAFGGILAAGPWFGWWVLVPPTFGGAFYIFVRLRVRRFYPPEYAVLVAWLVFQATIALGFVLARGAPLFALLLLCNMAFTASAVFPARAVVVGVSATALLMCAAALDMSTKTVLENPATLAMPLASLVSLALAAWTVGQSTIDHRSASGVDALTGLLNRRALEARTAELEVQSRATGRPVAVVVCDLDHFKAVNDGHGHAAGDNVLREAAYRIRKGLRAFESAYRFGGEEFVVLLPGAQVSEAELVAERLWRVIREEPLDGHAVTMSVGVAVSAPGMPFDYAEVFRRADEALLIAKHTGRDRVRSHRPEGEPGDGAATAAALQQAAS